MKLKKTTIVDNFWFPILDKIRIRNIRYSCIAQYMVHVKRDFMYFYQHFFVMIFSSGYLFLYTEMQYKEAIM